MPERDDDMGMCPFTADTIGERGRCFTRCQLWVDSEKCCSIRLIAKTLEALEELYAEAQGYEVERKET